LFVCVSEASWLWQNFQEREGEGGEGSALFSGEVLEGGSCKIFKRGREREGPVGATGAASVGAPPLRPRLLRVRAVRSTV